MIKVPNRPIPPVFRLLDSDRPRRRSFKYGDMDSSGSSAPDRHNRYRHGPQTFSRRNFGSENNHGNMSTCSHAHNDNATAPPRLPAPDVNFAELSRIFYKIIKLCHHLDHVAPADDKIPSSIRNMMHQLCAMLKPAFPDFMVCDTIKHNAQQWWSVTLRTLEQHYSTLLSDLLFDVALYYPKFGPLPFWWQPGGPKRTSRNSSQHWIEQNSSLSLTQWNWDSFQFRRQLLFSTHLPRWIFRPHLQWQLLSSQLTTLTWSRRLFCLITPLLPQWAKQKSIVRLSSPQHLLHSRRNLLNARIRGFRTTWLQGMVSCPAHQPSKCQRVNAHPPLKLRGAGQRIPTDPRKAEATNIHDNDDEAEELHVARHLFTDIALKKKKKNHAPALIQQPTQHIKKT